RPYFLATLANVRRESVALDKPSHLGGVIALVHTHALRLPLGGHGALDGNALDGRLDELAVVPIGARDLQSYGHAARVGEQAALGSGLAAIGRVGSGHFPPRAAPWSSRRPSTANPTRSPEARRKPAGRGTRIDGTRPRRATRETGGMP